jgi:hypothetical protein
MTKPTAVKERDGEPSKGTKSRTPLAEYPKFSLEEALDIPRAIHDKYSGKPMPPKSLAEACGSSYGSSGWRMKLAASTAYGLTQGSYKSQGVQLMDTGRAVVAPRNKEEETTALREAARRPELLRRVYDHYDRGLPATDDNFFANVLTRDFGVPKDDVQRFAGILMANAAYAYSSPGEVVGERDQRLEEQQEAGEPRPAVRVEVPGTAVHVEVPPGTKEQVRVFIGHSKNEPILDVLRATMDLAGFRYEIAEQEETTAQPVPEKVLGLMRKCTAGIINVSADEQQKRGDGSFEINENVLIEIGAAFVLYYPHVILLWDKRLPVPSNLQGLYRCDYEGETLDAGTLLRLQKAIAKFRTGEGSQAQ